MSEIPKRIDAGCTRRNFIGVALTAPLVPFAAASVATVTVDARGLSGEILAQLPAILKERDRRLIEALRDRASREGRS